MGILFLSPIDFQAFRTRKPALWSQQGQRVTEENPSKWDFICNHMALGGGDLEKSTHNRKVGVGDSDLVSRLFQG